MATAALVLVSASLLAVPASAAAAGHGQQGRHPERVTHCKNDGHKYILGTSAKVHGKKATFTGTFERFHPCGLDDGYFTSNKKTITLTLTTKSTITIFKNELDPSATKTVTAAKFPHAFRKRIDEPHYLFSGPRSAVKKLTEHFVS
jgi:hypothetical protein